MERMVICLGERLQSIQDPPLLDRLQERIAAQASAQRLKLFLETKQMNNFRQLLFRIDLSNEIAKNHIFPLEKIPILAQHDPLFPHSNLD